MKKSLMTPRIASSPHGHPGTYLMTCGTIGGGLGSSSGKDPGGGLSSKSGTTYICSGTIGLTNDDTGLGSA